MGFLAKLFGAAPRNKQRGLSLGRDAFWEVAAVADLPLLFRALPLLLPEETVLYLEGGAPPKEIKAFLDAHGVPEVSRLAIGTIRPRPQVFHLPATSENLARFAEISERCHAMQVAIHLHAYRQDKVLLEWYDAFGKDPFYLSNAIPEKNVKLFCSTLSLTYSRCTDYVEQDSAASGRRPTSQ